MPSWQELDADLSATGDAISVYVGPLDGAPVFTRSPDRPHYAASTMKVAVLAALHRAAEAGTVDLDAPVPVDNEFESARPGAPRFGCTDGQGDDRMVWDRLGGTASLRWLAERMILRSSNLATNLVLAHVGLPAVAEVWTLAGARHSVTARGIEDFAARDAGLDNLVTAADLAALLRAIALGARDPNPETRRSSCGAPFSVGRPATDPGRLAAPPTCTAMLDLLLAQERREDLAAGLPAGVPIAHKSGWVRGVRHGAGVVLPPDAAPYTVVVCVSADPAGPAVRGDRRAGWDAAARALIARVSATAWAAR